MESTAARAVPSSAGLPAEDGRTRDRVTGLLLEHGPQTATELATRLGISAAAVRRHLDGLVAAGRVTERELAGSQRGRGRPARHFALTDAGRSAFPHAYDDLALTALRFVAEHGGPDAVRAVAEQQLSALAERLHHRGRGGRGTARGHRRPRAGARRRADRRGLRRHGLGHLQRRAAVPAPLPGRRMSRPSSRSCARPRPR